MFFGNTMFPASSYAVKIPSDERRVFSNTQFFTGDNCSNTAVVYESVLPIEILPIFGVENEIRTVLSSTNSILFGLICSRAPFKSIFALKIRFRDPSLCSISQTSEGTTTSVENVCEESIYRMILTLPVLDAENFTFIVLLSTNSSCFGEIGDRPCGVSR